MTMPVEYAAIKSGLIHLTKYMAKYFKGLNIKVMAYESYDVLPNEIKLHQLLHSIEQIEINNVNYLLCKLKYIELFQ